MDDTKLAGDPVLGTLALLGTSHVSDALDKLGINGQCMGLLPLVRDSRLAGRAFTVRYVPVTIGGVRVEPGDYLLGDADGVVVAPAGRASEIIDIAHGIRQAEENIRAAIESGQSLGDARRQYGYHQLQTRGQA